jgi:hypothetical protein
MDSFPPGYFEDSLTLVTNDFLAVDGEAGFSLPVYVAHGRYSWK